MIENITLLGSSSGRNAGDAALIAGIMDSIDESCGRRLTYDIPTIKPSFVRENYSNIVRPVGMLPWNASVKMLGVPTLLSVLRTDLTLVFDAILFDRALYNPLFNYLSTLRLLLPLAKRRGKRMGYFNVSAGPVNTIAGRKMLRDVSNMMDFLTVRDENSRDLLREIGVNDKPIVVTADAALTMRAASDERVDQIWTELGFSEAQPVLGINVSAYLDTWAGSKRKPLGKEKFLQSFSAGLSAALKKIDVAVLFVSTQHHDVPLTEELRARTTMNRPSAHMTNIRYSPYEIRGVLSRLQLLFGMRLHATILASAGLTPIAALPHQPKVSHYFKTIGVEDNILTFDDYSSEALTELLVRCWDARAKTRAQLERSIPVSREKARYAATLVKALSDGENL